MEDYCIQDVVVTVKLIKLIDAKETSNTLEKYNIESLDFYQNYLYSIPDNWVKDKNLSENSEEENKSPNVINDQNKIKISEEIIKLKELRDNGVLTNEEYERAINKILN